MSNERHSGRDSPTGSPTGNVRDRPRSRSEGKKLPPPDRRPTRHGAIGDLAAFRLADDFAATTQTDKQRDGMTNEILLRPRYFNAIDTYQRNLREKEYVIHIESLSIQRNDDDGIFNKVDFGFLVPVHADYSIRININFDKLHDSDKENMEKVVFWNSRWGKICRLLDLYLCTKGELSHYMAYHFMGLEFKNKSYGLKHSLEMAFEDGYLTIEGYNNRPLLDVILKAGELSDNYKEYKEYKEHTRPYLLGMIRAVLRNRPQRGGRVQRQRRRGRTILSRKKRNTRMKKYKRHNKSKKIKS